MTGQTTDVVVLQLIDEANLAATNDDWQSALNTLQKALRLDKTHPGILNGIATCLIQLGRQAEAIPYLQKVTDLLPKVVDAKVNLANQLMGLERWEEAVKVYKGALDLDPQNIFVQKNLAVLCLKIENQVQEGLALLVNILRNDPKDLEAVLMLALAFQDNGQIEESKKLFQYALSLDPDNTLARQHLGDDALQNRKVGRKRHLKSVKR